jgi:HTH-type transcriptional regulator/antitoxin HigA
MDIKPINDEQEYEQILAEIDTLIDAEANTVAGEGLDALAMLADAWEEKHYPIEPPDPIEAIRFAHEQRGT